MPSGHAAAFTRQRQRGYDVPIVAEVWFVRRRSWAVSLIVTVIVALVIASSSGAFTPLPRPGSALAPGVVTLARVGTSRGSAVISVYRARYLGGVVLCIDQLGEGDTGGAGGCVTYPLGPGSKYQSVGSDIWVLNGGGGFCGPHPFEVVTAIVIHNGLTAWLRTPNGLSRMQAVTVPKTFNVSGPLVYAVLTKAPDTIQLRTASGKVASSTPAFSAGPPGYCGGLNPDTTSN